MGRTHARRKPGLIGRTKEINPAIKEALLERLNAYLDQLDGAEAPEADVAQTAAATRMASDGAGEAGDEEARDLFSVYVEIAAARNEVRAQSRIVKDALDQFRAVFETLQSSNAALDRELRQTHERAGDRARTALRPLLIDLLDVRDQLAAGLAAGPPGRARPWWARWRRTAAVPNPWREGVEMTLRRLDRVLADRRVTPIATVGRKFAPAVSAGGGDKGRSVRGGGVCDRQIPCRLRVGRRFCGRRR